VLKPLERSDSSFSIATAVVYGVFALVAVGTATFVRGQEGEPHQLVLILGSFLVAVPVVRAGYGFLSDDELESFYGRELWVRTLICAGVYAALWGVYGYGIQWYVFQGAEMELYHFAIVVPPIAAVGAFAGLACLDLDFINGLVHYGMYLLVTVILRWIMGMPL
jgi:hypothetical protein